MALSVWPVTLPKFDAQGYSLAVQDDLLRTSMTSGRVRVRQRSTFVATDLTCTWIMTHAQLRILREFYITTLSKGTASFTMPIYAAALGADAQGYKNHEVQFTVPYVATYRTQATWTISGQLVILEEIPNV